MKSKLLVYSITTSVVCIIGIIFVLISFTIALKYSSATYSGFSSLASNNKTTFMFKPLVKFSSSDYLFSSTVMSETKSTVNSNLSECGKPVYQQSLKFTSRIISGSQALPHSFPWIVSLRLLRSNILYDHFCAAVLISSRFVLTAAHCVIDLNINDLIAVVGLHVRNEVSERVLKNSHRISKMILHEKFDRKTIENDIAILKLDKEIIYSDKILPICLPDLNSRGDYLNRDALIAGWGSNSNNSANLQQTIITLIANSNEKCKAYLNTNKKDLMYCALNSENHANACTGDSGGPLAIRNEENRWILIGIVSYVSAVLADQTIKCNPGEPSFYTKISSYIDWIKSNHIQLENNQRL